MSTDPWVVIAAIASTYPMYLLGSGALWRRHTTKKSKPIKREPDWAELLPKPIMREPDWAELLDIRYRGHRRMGSITSRYVDKRLLWKSGNRYYYYWE